MTFCWIMYGLFFHLFDCFTLLFLPSLDFSWNELSILLTGNCSHVWETKHKKNIRNIEIYSTFVAIWKIPSFLMTIVVTIIFDFYSQNEYNLNFMTLWYIPMHTFDKPETTVYFCKKKNTKKKKRTKNLLWGEKKSLP